MGIIKKEEIRGYRTGSEIVCLECITDQDQNQIDEESSYIMNSEVDDSDDLYFCDRCKKQL
jgi:hypothetical protein